MKKNEKRIEITNESDVTEASFEALRLGEMIDFSRAKYHMVSTAVSELGTNIYRYAQSGSITLRVLENDEKKGIEVIAEDKGPGIADVEAAMGDNFSTSNSLGVGLPGVKRMMDEFTIETKPGTGTKITVRKWV